jgi:hypothetical protein
MQDPTLIAHAFDVVQSGCARMVFGSIRFRAGAARLWFAALLVMLGKLLLLPGSVPVFAQGSSGLPTLYTNEMYIDDVTKPASLDVGDVKAVLAYVLGQLPARVRVFPTENYYYFYFFQGGIRYSGNFRLDIEQRDKGLVEFIYFKDSTDWLDDATDHHATFGAADGVVVEKVADLSYRVSFSGKSVIFDLNDLSTVKPPDAALGDSDTFLGPVADESGLRFFLIFNESTKLFQYVLDETVPVGDELVPAKTLPRLLIGRRTGFVFIEDPNRARKLLVAVYGPNVDVNNYLDGPFDQLPDNFLKGDELRRAILLAQPDQDQSIDRLGIHRDADYRVSSDPYLQYYSLEDLAPVAACVAKDGPDVYRCLDAVFSK